MSVGAVAVILVVVVVVFKGTFKCGLELQGEADPGGNSANCNFAVELGLLRLRSSYY